MWKSFFTFLVCGMFLFSHMVELDQCCLEKGHGDSISKTAESKDAAHKDCDLSCHHHLSLNFPSFPSFVKIATVYKIVFSERTLQLKSYEEVFLRPPAIS